MPKVSVRIPQIGEGLQEARLVAVLKQPGDTVRRDEPIYQMETDKAVMDVESPYAGVLVSWQAEVDAILPIGGEVAIMDVEGEVQEMAAHGAPAASAAASEPSASSSEPSSARTAGIPPRTRAYAKEKGVGDEDLARLAATTNKLMPADIDAFLASGGSRAAAPAAGAGYSETALSQKQRVLASRLTRGSQLVVPGTISVQCSWEEMDQVRAAAKARGADNQPSAFTMFAYCVALTLKDFPAFRSTLRGDEILRTYDHSNLGIAVARPGDELVIAAVEDADTLDWGEFSRRTRERIDEARNGKDQASESVTISLTNMQAFGLRDAVAVVVPPAVATLFLGEVYYGQDGRLAEPSLKRLVNLSLTFDHRLINGVGAADFLNAVKQKVETVSSLIAV